MEIKEFCEKVYDRTGDRATISYAGTWSVTVGVNFGAGSWHLPVEMDNPKTMEGLKQYLDQKYSVLDSKLTPSDTDVIFISKEGEEITVSENLTQFEKMQMEMNHVENPTVQRSLRWRFFRAKDLFPISVRKRHSDSIAALGIYYKPDDSNFYFQEKQYDPKL